jgi:hypothetical protein
VDLDRDASSLVTMLSHAVDLSLVQKGFLSGHEPCGRLRSSSELVIGSIRFWKDLIDSLSYHVLL